MSGDHESKSWPPRADGRLGDWPEAPRGEETLFARLRDLCEEGLEISSKLERAREGEWDSFVPADYDTVLRSLLEIRGGEGRFLELGSATGVVAIMADLLGFEACGIEIVPDLIAEARGLAERYDSDARFAVGSYMPQGYRYESESGDTRLGALGIGHPAYDELGFELSDFAWVYAYPWPGEGDVIRDVMKHRGAPQATLLIHGHTGVIERVDLPAPA